MAPRLAAVPDRPRRVLGLIRVSAIMGRDELESPDIQRVAITDAAARRGYEVVGWVEGIDESGSKAKSPWWAKLDEAVARVESGDVDGIMVWKFSRAARHRLKMAIALDRIEAVGGVLESATEEFDVSTATGRLGRGMVTELSVFQSDLIGEGWKETHAARVRSGRPHSGGPRFGYTYDRETKSYAIDPESGPLLADLYRRFVAGESGTGLAHWLNAHGYRTTTGGSWSTATVLKMLDSGFGAGFIRYQQLLHPGVQEPVIDAELWQRYLDARDRSRRTSPRRRASRWALSGVCVCGECGRNMHIGMFGTKGAEAPYVRCAQRYLAGASVCSMGRYVPLRVAEGAVLAWLREVAEQVEEFADAEDIAVARRVTHEATAERLAREAVRVEGELTRLAIANARTPLPQSVYDRTVAELSEQLRTLQAKAEDAAAAARDAPTDVGVLATGLLSEWNTLPAAPKRELLRQALSALVVWPDERTKSGFRFWPVPKWRER